MLPVVWWTNTAFTSALYSDGSGLSDSSAPQPAREVIGGCGTVDGGAEGAVADGLADMLVEGDGDAEALGVVSVGVGDVVVSPSVGVAVVPSVGAVESVGVAAGLLSSATNAAGSVALASASVTTPGSTRLTSSPLGSAPVVPSLWTTCT